MSACNLTAVAGNGTSASNAEEAGENTVGELIASIVLTVIGGALLAYSMTVQRYGLAHPEKYITLCRLKVHRLLVWFLGMMLYGVANALKVVAFNLGPLAVLGSVFTVLLVFNSLKLCAPELGAAFGVLAILYEGFSYYCLWELVYIQFGGKLDDAFLLTQDNGRGTLQRHKPMLLWTKPPCCCVWWNNLTTKCHSEPRLAAGVGVGSRGVSRSTSSRSTTSTRCTI